MKLDAHVHTFHSGRTTIFPVHKILNESYNTPEGVYRLAKKRGMDLVAITDHDVISGALTIADRPDVIVGCEVTGVFPEDKVKVHIGTLGVTESQHREIDKLRHDVRELMPYLKQQRIFTSLNHLASRVAGQITPVHLAALIPWLDGIEILNGTRPKSQNRTAAALASAHRKVGVAGSDSHTYRGIGKTCIVADTASNREEFLECLRQGRVRVEGHQGSYFKFCSDILRLTARFYEDGWIQLAKQPLRWNRQAMVLGSLIGLPLIPVPLIGIIAHLVLEERFNTALLFDLVARPAEFSPDNWNVPLVAHD